MSRLKRSFPIGQRGDVRGYTSPDITLLEERGLSILRVTAKEISASLDAGLAELAGAPGAIAPNTVIGSDTLIAALSRRERLVFSDAADDQGMEDKIRGFAGPSALVVDVTHQYAVIRISGTGAQEVLSSLTPLSFDDDRLAAGQCLRTVFGDTEVFVHRPSGEANYRLIFDQAFADYAWRLLEDAAGNLM